MSKFADKLKNKGKSKGFGFELMKSVETIAQQVVIHTALLSDPQSAAIALLNQAQPSIEQVAETREIEKEKSESKKSGHKQKKTADKVKGSKTKKGDKKKNHVSTTDKNKLKNENKILEKKIKTNNLKLAQKKK